MITYKQFNENIDYDYNKRITWLPGLSMQEINKLLKILGHKKIDKKLTGYDLSHDSIDIFKSDFCDISLVYKDYIAYEFDFDNLYIEFFIKDLDKSMVLIKKLFDSAELNLSDEIEYHNVWFEKEIENEFYQKLVDDDPILAGKYYKYLTPEQKETYKEFITLGNDFDIFEALKISDYRKYKNMDIYSDNHDEFKEYFNSFSDKSKNGYRIYLPIEIKKNIPWDVCIKEFLAGYGYYTDYDYYIKGVCFKQDINGLIKDRNRPLKIGRVLMDIGNDDMYKRYGLDPARQLKKDDFMVVISRHFYDVLGMSTDRGWTSCHDLYDRKYAGRYHYQMHGVIEGGALVAYLTRKNDRNLKNPISRITILIYEFKNKEKYRLVPERHMYGFQTDEFHKLVDEWCDDYNEKHYDGGGTYYSKHVYTEMPSRISR